jgi:hypothetical protein
MDGSSYPKEGLLLNVVIFAMQSTLSAIAMAALNS